MDRSYSGFLLSLIAIKMMAALTNILVTELSSNFIVILPLPSLLILQIYKHILMQYKQLLFIMRSENLPPERIQQSLNDQAKKREGFREQIRSRQIEEIKKQIRMKYYELKDPNDFQLLRSINLMKTISQCKKHNLSDQIVHALFLYASSQNSDHLFSLIDDKTINILVDALLSKDPATKRTVLNRKIFWLLTNYTAYSQAIDEQYLKKLQQIAKSLMTQQCNNSVQNMQPYETQQNIVLSLSNLCIKSKNCYYLMKNNCQLLLTILQRFSSRSPSIIELMGSAFGSVPRLVDYYVEFIHNLYTAIDYKCIQEKLQTNTVKYIVKLLQQFQGANGQLSEETKRISLNLLDSLTKLFGNSLDNHPQLIIWHKKQIYRLASWFETFMKTQSASQKCDQIVVKYITFLKIVYGPNIPEEHERQISKIFRHLFENHVGKVCMSMLKNNKPLFHTYALRLLQPILMEEYLAQLIIQFYLPIVSYIFHQVKNSEYAHRKQALTCLINLLKSTLYPQSSTASQVLEIVLANKVADILAFNLWAYVDADLNLQLLQGVKILFQAQSNRYASKLNFWQKFQEAGGTLKMDRILAQSSNPVLRDQIDRILNLVNSTTFQE